MGIETFKTIAEYGVSVVGLVSVALFLAWLIKFILFRNKERESLYMDLMKTDLKYLTEATHRLSDSLSNFANSVQEAHKFQREEHSKQIDILNSACLQHKEMILSLGRINGYKEDHR